MNKRLNNQISRWWLTPKFPDVHIKKVTSYKPKGTKNLIKDRYRTWIYHPLKRRTAKYYLVLLKKLFGIRVIAITGSAGKTTVKDMVSSILSLEGNTVSSYKNIDSVYNIPTTILKCKPGTKYLILEMGVEFPDEMDYYLWLVKPDIGVITNIYPTHIKYFRNVDGVAKEKVKLVSSLGSKEYAVLNNENTLLIKKTKDIDAKTCLYGEKSKNTASNIKMKSIMSTTFTLNLGKSKINVQITLIGKQFVSNALASALTVKLLGISDVCIKKGLENFQTDDHRMKIIKSKKGSVVIDDCYNNNPEAAKRAIDSLCLIAKGKRKVVVFGDMLELGRKEDDYHKELGAYMADKKIDVLIGVGKLSKFCVSEFKRKLKNNYSKSFTTTDRVGKELDKLCRKGDYILIKGSRSIGLEEVVKYL